MRTTMKIALAAVLVSGAGSLALAMPQDRDPGDRDPSDLSAMADQIEIMRVVLADSISAPLADLYNGEVAEAGERLDRVGDRNLEAAGLTSLRDVVAAYGISDGTQFTSHTRGYYARGVGIMFSTEVCVPVRFVEQEAVIDETEPDEEWREAQQKVRARKHGRRVPGFDERDGAHGRTRRGVCRDDHRCGARHALPTRAARARPAAR